MSSKLSKELEEELGKLLTAPVSRGSSSTATDEFKQETEVVQDFSINKLQDSRSSSKVSLLRGVHTMKLARPKVTLCRVLTILALFISAFGVWKYMKL